MATHQRAKLNSPSRAHPNQRTKHSRRSLQAQLEEILGEGRYWAVKETLANAALTPDEAVKSLKNKGEDFYKTADGTYFMMPSSIGIPTGS